MILNNLPLRIKSRINWSIKQKADEIRTSASQLMNEDPKLVSQGVNKDIY